MIKYLCAWLTGKMENEYMVPRMTCLLCAVLGSHILNDASSDPVQISLPEMEHVVSEHLYNYIVSIIRIVRSPHSKFKEYEFSNLTVPNHHLYSSLDLGHSIADMNNLHNMDH